MKSLVTFLAELEFHAHGGGLSVAIGTERLVVALRACIGGRVCHAGVLPDEIAGV